MLVALSPLIGIFFLLHYEIKDLPVFVWLMVAGLVALLGYFDVQWFRHYTTSAVICHSVLAALLVIVCLTVFFSKSDTTKLARAWVSAKHSKVCPLVSFVEKDQ